AFVQIEVRPAACQSRHGGEVNDCFDPGEQIFEGIAAQVERVETKARMTAEPRQVRFLRGARIKGDKRIESDDAMPRLEQVFAEVGADESGGAGDETFHSSILSGH